MLPHFFEIAADELARPASAVDIEKLEALLELAVRSTSARGDEHKDELGLRLVHTSIASELAHINTAGLPSGSSAGAKAGAGELTGFEAFAFDFVVEWPLNLVISSAALTKYRLLNRHLIKSTRVCKAMSAAWAIHKLTKTAHVQAYFKRAYALRSKMLHFVSSFSNYMFYQVLEPAWAQLTATLAAATSLADVVTAHEAFLNAALKECLLTHPELLKLLTKLMSTCSIFVDYTAHLSATLSLDGDSIFVIPPGLVDSAVEGLEEEAAIAQALAVRREHAAAAVDTTATVLDDKYHRTLAKFEENFGYHMRLFLQTINLLSGTEKHLAALFATFDFNGFYGDALGLFSYA